MQVPRGRLGASRLLRALSMGEDSLVDELPLYLRDRLVAELYLACFGPSVEAQVLCRHCGEPVGFQFDLPAFMSEVATVASLASLGLVQREDGFLEGEGGAVRLPTLEDERAVAHLEEQAAIAWMRARCLRPGDSNEDVLDAWLEKLGPFVAGSFDVRCSQCSESSEVVFDVCAFLIDALASERALVLREIHWLARYYGWSLSELMALPRSQRRQLVELVLAESGQRGAA